tara:strand:- start:3344 stop:4903 length:1560 start_codon:yes stop_codon:yes gene_type:complete
MRYHDADATLPAVAAAVNDRDSAGALWLTIIFHPDPSRIGQRAQVPVTARSAPWFLGRCNPVFGGLDVADAPLNDQYVSRRALQFVYSSQGLELQRLEGTSRCRVADGELFSAVVLEREQLQRGVPVMLSHSVVLLLREAPRPVAGHTRTRAGEHILGASVRMQMLRGEILRAARSDLDILIRGETGSGKELVAGAIHAASARRAGPLVSVNVAAIPPELAAAALFGSARGAFTGAERATAGYFREAAGGSLFLDEIGDAAASVQPQLLRALQQREIQSVGGAVESVDLRVISATDVSLDEPESDFRAALRHRLAACEIRVPPLREHPEDIGELFVHFIRAAASETDSELPLPGPDLDPTVIAAWADIFFIALRYSWPGNVRELANVARQIVLAGDDFPRLDAHLLALLTRAEEQPQVRCAAPVRRRIQDIPEQVFERAMLTNNFEIKAVAACLGVSRAAVYRRIEQTEGYRLASRIPLPEISQMLDDCDGDCERAAARLQVSFSSLRVRLRNLHSGAA